MNSYINQKQKSISMLMVLLILILCAGCAKKEAAWSLEELSDKQKEKIEEAWKERQETAYPFKITENNYYGSCGDCVIIFLETSLSAIGHLTVAEEEFIYSTCFTIWVYKKGEIIQLADAYAEGWLTDENIADIAEYHRERTKPKEE